MIPDQPPPTPGGTDVILDLAEALRTRKRIPGYLHGLSSGIRTDTEDLCYERNLDLCDELLARREVGIERYGTPLQTRNGRDAGLDELQELLDALAYMWQAHIEGQGR